ncbi:RNA polymerase Rpb1, domain 5 [Ostertagia ostertagi]
MGKIQFRDSDSSQKVVGVKFSAGSSGFIRQSSHIQVINDRLYEEGARNWTPAKCGPLDQRLVSATNCVGHFGYVDLAFPVFHVGYFKLIIQVIQCICKNCAGLLLSENQRSHFLRQIANPDLNYPQRKTLHRSIVAACKTNFCLRCGQKSGIVRKAPGSLLKIAYGCEIPESEMSEYSAVMEANSTIRDSLHSTKFTLLNPLRVQKLFSNVKEEDIPILMLRSGEAKHPNDLLLTKIPVPPACIRPSVPSETGSGSTEDDLTVKLAEIILINNVLQKHKEGGAPMKTVMETWDHLQIQVALYFNGELPALPPELRQKKPFRGLYQRLKGKHGRFRGNLSGKRVDYTARTVISPDPNLRIDEVGVPLEVALTLTYPEIVNEYNITRMKKLIISGPDTHPGANYVVDHVSGVWRYSNREMCAKNLKVGDIVERHVDNNDIVLFNRQPSLHKVSIMCHRVRLCQGKTFRLNECVCAPYNADFDGDEMNLHVPQTQEARAEASLLMGVKSNLVTPRSGEPLVAAIQAYRLAASIIDHDIKKQARLRLPTPAIVKPVRLWTGKQLMSLVISDDLKNPVKLNLSVPNKSYTCGKELCCKDSFVIIRNGELLSGVLDKSLLGTGSKTSIFFVLLRDFNEDAAVDALLVFWTALYTLFPVVQGIGDVRPSLQLSEEKSLLLREGYEKCQEYIAQFKSGQLKPQPGCTMEETLEASLLKELSSIRDKAGKACVEKLSKYSSPLVMAVSGSKGSYINISQMIACVGQQAISGHRPPDGFDKRSLPHFEKSQKTPEAKGFVENSFFSGLTPTEFFFHSMAGREGIVDTAVKTAETGYMQRRLVKSLEDLCVSYDGTVRSSSGDVIQFVFGEDRLDPALMEASDGYVINFAHQLEHIRNTIPFNHDEELDRAEMETLCKEVIEAEIGVSHPEFRRRIEAFVEEIIAKSSAAYKIPRFCGDHLKGKTQVLRHCVSRAQLAAFLEKCCWKLKRAVIEPGTAVGAIAATSIGEPSTQMTLKTFHFAGVASMNITQGEICDYIEEVVKPDSVFLLLKLSAKRIKLLNLEVTMSGIVKSIISSKSYIAIKASQITVVGKSMLIVRPSSDNKRNMLITLQIMKQSLQKVIVKGLPDVKRCVVRADERNGDKYSIIVEGNDFLRVLSQVGIDPRHSNMNNAVVVAEVLGIEAARTCIINEILTTMEAHGITLDRRHVMLLADVMTYRGEVLGITRNGLAKMKDSVLLLASFEKTMDHLFEAAFYSQKDPIRGVSESIILGVPISIGTGMFGLLQKTPTPATASKVPIFMKPEFGLKV